VATPPSQTSAVSPVSQIEARIAQAVEKLFGAEQAQAAKAAVKLSRSQHADYQCNVALALAQKVKQPPRKVAEALLGELEAGGGLGAVCETIEIAGPGYLNLTLRAEALAEALRAMGDDARLGVTSAAAPDTVVIDYSSPNVAKELHVGHLRGTILGDALARVLDHLGHEVVRQNHLGDWGTPFGMLLENFVDDGATELARGDWTTFYQAARAKFDGDPAFAERARRRVVLLQGGDEETLVLWRALVAQSVSYLEELYSRLDVTLRPADIAGESRYNDELDGVVEELRKVGLLVESDGALCVFPAGFKGKTGDPLPLIVRKQGGGYGYASTDLATIRHRVGALGGTRLLYVVGAPQQLHLAMVFAVAREAGWLKPPVVAEHVSFGAVLGADKKMFKTRSGDNVSLSSLVDEACVRADAAVAARSPSLSAEERVATARAIGVGALKYADLSTDRNKDYVFDWDRMLAFEGNTGPYLQYAHARIRSLLRHETLREQTIDPRALRPIEPAERALALELLDFAATVQAVGAQLAPHRLCTYLFQLATRFTTFYEQCPVLRAETTEIRDARLALAGLTARTLATGLGLLGITAPERM
jgi:arginyl-tRNA synthetase